MADSRAGSNTNIPIDATEITIDVGVLVLSCIYVYSFSVCEKTNHEIIKSRNLT
jgi:hypothetical protein